MFTKSRFLIRALIYFAAVWMATSAQADWSALSSAPVVSSADQSIIRHEWTSSATDSTPYLISSCTGGVEGRFDASTGDSSSDATFQFRLCQNSTDTAGRCRQIGWPGPSNGATWVPLNAVTQGENYILADALTATAGGDTARVEVRCTTSQSIRSEAGGTLVQSAPSTQTNADATTGYAIKPVNTKFGHGISMEAEPPAFAAETYPSSGVDGSELDNQMGWFYNKASVIAETALNMFETAWDASWELAYRSSPGGSDGANTADETLVEWNWDFIPPDIQSTLSGSSGSFVAGDTLSFSGGGTGYVVSAGPPLIFRHDSGITAAGETVTNITRTGSGTLGALTYVGTNRIFRPFIFYYYTKQHKATFDFDTFYGDGQTTFSVSSGYPRMNGNLMVGLSGADTHGPAYWAISNGGSIDSGTEVANLSTVACTCVDVMEFSTPATPTDSSCAATHANAVKFVVFCK